MIVWVAICTVVCFGFDCVLHVCVVLWAVGFNFGRGGVGVSCMRSIVCVGCDC